MTSADLPRVIDQRNRALHADQVLTERIRGLISDYLRRPGSRLPEPSLVHPPRTGEGSSPKAAG